MDTLTEVGSNKCKIKKTEFSILNTIQTFIRNSNVNFNICKMELYNMINYSYRNAALRNIGFRGILQETLIGY